MELYSMLHNRDVINAKKRILVPNKQFENWQEGEVAFGMSNLLDVQCKSDVLNDSFCCLPSNRSRSDILNDYFCCLPGNRNQKLMVSLGFSVNSACLYANKCQRDLELISNDHFKMVRNCRPLRIKYAK